MNYDRTIAPVASILAKVSAEPLLAEQIARATAFVRAHNICSYNPFIKEQCMSLDQMEANKGVILCALSYLHDGAVRANGYKIRYNPLFGMWQCRYDGALYGEFKELPDAIEYCNKG